MDNGDIHVACWNVHSICGNKKQQTLPLQQVRELVIYDLSKCSSPGHVTFYCNQHRLHRKVIVLNDVVTQDIVEPRIQHQGRGPHNRVLLEDLNVDIQQNIWSGTLSRRKKCHNISID